MYPSSYVHNSLVPRLSSAHTLEPGNEATYTTNVTLELLTKTKDATTEEAGMYHNSYLQHIAPS